VKINLNDSFEAYRKVRHKTTLLCEIRSSNTLFHGNALRYNAL